MNLDFFGNNRARLLVENIINRVVICNYINILLYYAFFLTFLIK